MPKKKNRDSGKMYTSRSKGNVIAARKIGPPCRCRHFDKMAMDVIKEVFKNLWALKSYDTDDHLQEYDV